MPKFKKKNVKRKGKKAGKKKAADYTPFPPEQPLRKVDKQLASGEYFLKPEERDSHQHATKLAQQTDKSEQRKRDRAADFVAPAEALGGAGGAVAADSAAEIAKRLKKASKKRKGGAATESYVR